MALPPSRRDSIGPPSRDVSDLASIVRHQGSYLRSLDPGILGGTRATPRPVPRVPSQLVGSDGDGGGEDSAEWEDGDRLIVAAAGPQVWKLSHEPLEESLFVRWHPRGLTRAGIPWPNEHWSLDADTVTIPDTTGLIEVADAFSAQYMYIGDDEIDTKTYFQEVMARHPVGFWNFNGTYADDSGNGYSLTAASSNVFTATQILTEPTGQGLDLGGLAAYTFSGTPVAAIDAIAGAFSVVWAGADGNTGNHGYGNIIGQGNAGDHHFRVQHDQLTSPHELVVEWHDGTANRTHHLPLPAAPTGRHFWGVSVGASTVSAYVDGILTSQVPKVTAPVAQAGGRYVCVGTDGATNQRWLGQFDGVALFASTLTGEDHATLATAAGYA